MLPLAPAAHGQIVQAWPAESWSAAVNLTAVEGPGANDFHEDLSGAFWNPVTRRLWLCRNGPSGATSKLWCLKETGTGWFEVDTRAGNRGEWTNFGDFEAVTQVNLNTDVVYAMIEGEEVIRQYAVAIYGAQMLQRTWNTSPHLPLSGAAGAEGLAFVPNAHLRAAGFVDPAGVPREGTRGMGGLMFVGHQNGGRVYVFDLDPNSSAFTFVGAYRTADSETAELFFDRSTGVLHAWHGNSNRLESMSLASTVSGSERRFVTLGLHSAPPGTPSNANIEGLAIADNGDATGGRRSLFMTIDDGGATSLLWFRNFPTICRADVNGSGTLTVQDIFDFLVLYFSNAPSADFNFSGAVTVQDLFDFLAAYFTQC